jgi:hypothetical protein
MMVVVVMMMMMMMMMMDTYQVWEQVYHIKPAMCVSGGYLLFIQRYVTELMVSGWGLHSDPLDLFDAFNVVTECMVLLAPSLTSIDPPDNRPLF